jgi:hypothetical protein
MRITYIGHLDGVEVPVGNAAVTVAHGETVDLPDAVARGLLDQTSQWRRGKPAAKTDEGGETR